MTSEHERAMIERWKAATRAAGIQLSDEDIERTAERGFLARAVTVEALIDRIVTGVEIPDYLDLVTTTTGEAHRG
ncbi:MAG TPA: hypothetical protein PKA95_11805 [Thermomicrobiales bacterium]|nr:hypothetical protein [Thermomicrobiales bacterium]